MDSKIDHIKDQLKTGLITRREFAHKLMVLGIAGTSAGTLLTWADQTQAAGKRGGRLRPELLMVPPPIRWTRLPMKTVT